MKAVILCGGKGTRLGEETHLRPKPMVEIGGKPILSHIIDIYSKHGVKDFYLALGYKKEFIKDYFLRYHKLNSDFKVDLKSGSYENLGEASPHKDISVNLIDTGDETLTGGRLLRLKKYLQNEESFMLTYGDGVANVNIQELIQFHKKHGKTATVTAVRPPARFGEMLLNDDKVQKFSEKPQTSEGWINGGFFIFTPKIFEVLENDETILERSPLEKLSEMNELMAFKHNDFWQCMDTLRDKVYLNKLWDDGNATWLN